jgi:chemotaxis protein methyltransferase CheR
VQVSEASQRRLADLLKSQTGQDFPAARGWRIGTALSGLFRTHGIASLDQLVAKLALSRHSSLAREVVEALLNNETYFFRDRAVFDLLATKVLPELAERRASTRQLSIWSVGCSTGQEALSLAMLFAEREARWAGWTIRILGTDVSRSVIDVARSACYTPFQIQRGLAVGQMVQFFDETPQGWCAQDRLRRMVRFELHNILDPLSALGSTAPGSSALGSSALGSAPANFDLILCRNVLLYFGDTTRARAFERLGSALAPDGWLILGAGETTIGQTDLIAPDRSLPSLYRHAACADIRRAAAG